MPDEQLLALVSAAGCHVVTFGDRSIEEHRCYLAWPRREEVAAARGKS